MKVLIGTSAIAAALVLSGCAAVPAHYPSHQAHTPSTYSHANRHRDCWREPVAARSYTPEIAGAIIGGVAGNQFGSGRGRDIATVAGAVLGGSVGHDYKNRYHGPNYRVVCR